MKFSVVPESSERWTTVMSLSGSSRPSFCFWICSSFHFLISPEKTFAMVSASILMPSTPSRL